MRLFLLAIGAVGLLLAPSAGRADIDPTFGVGGVAATSVVDTFGAEVSLAVQSDDKIVVATHEAGDFAVFRFTAAGALDPTFGVAGKALVDVGDGDHPLDVALQPDGRILVTGRHDDGSVYRLALARLLSDGSLDTSFGTAGVVSDAFDSITVGEAVIADASGGILVAGWAGIGNIAEFGSFVARYDATGTLDPTFATDGVRSSGFTCCDPAIGEALYDIGTQADGKIVAVGMSTVALTFEGEYAAAGDWWVRRFLPDGTPDASFSGSGATGIYGFTDEDPAYFPMKDARGVAIQPDGRILVVGGNDPTWSGSDTIVSARLESDGESLDATYGNAGLVITRPYPRSPFWPILPELARAAAVSVHVRSDGTQVLVGPGTPDFVSGPYSAIALRLLADGSPDPTWSGDGLLEIGGFGATVRTDSALQADERVILATRVDGAIELRRLLGFYPCGNGLPDAGEDCDDGNTLAGDCCSPTCQFESAGAACTDDGNTCTTDACDGAGVCDHTILPDGQSCTDDEVCTHSDACAAGVCVGAAEPAAGCRLGTAGSLFLRNAGGSKDKLTWIWKKGQETLISEVPAQPYALCLYQGAVSTLVGSFDVPGPPDGADHRFKETPMKTVYSSKGAAFDGVKQIVLRAADEGKSVVKMKGIGASLPTPTLPLLTPVVAQLHGENGVCFEGTYSAPTRNDALLFRAKLD